MSEKDRHFIKRYEELLDKGYCDCNEMNCIDNNSPRRILNIVKDLQNQLQQKENIIKEVREKLLCYGETFDLKVHQQMQKELLEILDRK